MKRPGEPAIVDTDGGWPARVEVAGRVYRTGRVLDAWVLEGGWWTGETERRVYFRLLTRCGATLEVYRSELDWRLARILD